MTEIEGPYSWTKKGKGYFLSWYEDFKKQEAPLTIMKGYYGRKDTSLIKLAMVSSASKSASRLIDEDDILLGVEWLAANEASMLTVSQGLGQTEVGRRLEFVLGIIKKNSPIPHSLVLQRVSHQMNGRELGEVIETLRDSKRIISTTLNSRRVYTANLKD